MKKDISNKYTPIYRTAFYCFLLVIAAVPIIVTAHTDNPFHIMKEDALKIFGGIFMILISLVSLYKSKNKKIDNPTLIFEKNFDPYVTLFFVAAAISTIFSINPSVSYNGYYTRPLGLDVFLYIFFVYLFSSALLRDNKTISIILMTMEISAVIISIYAFLQFTGNDPIHLQPSDVKRPFGTLGNSVFLGGLLILVFPISLIRIIKKKKFHYSILSPVIILIAIVISGTRSAYAAVIIEAVVILFLYPFAMDYDKTKLKRGIKLSVYILGSVVFVLVVLVLFNRSNFYVNRFINIISITKDPRWLLWRDSFQVFLKYPITGCGISTFPMVFENLYTMEFKINDVRANFDNAHSNFLHTLCTMGIIGITAYLLLLGHTIYILFKTIFSKALKSRQKIIYLGFIALVFGYIVYGIADFDEISIMFYFFIYVSILKSIYTLDNNSTAFMIPQKSKKSWNKGYNVVIIILLLFISYNFYLTYKQVKADSYYITAFNLSLQQRFNQSLDYFTSAIELWDDNSFYHYQYSAALLSYTTGNVSLNDTTKIGFLKKAKSELYKAKIGYPSGNDCLFLISLIDFEIGDTVEAVQIKNQLLGRDSLMISFRLGLAQHYLNKKKYEQSEEQLLFVYKYDPANKLLPRAIEFIINDKNCPDRLSFCKKIIAIDPRNAAANQYIRLNQK